MSLQYLKSHSWSQVSLQLVPELFSSSEAMGMTSVSSLPRNCCCTLQSLYSIDPWYYHWSARVVLITMCLDNLADWLSRTPVTVPSETLSPLASRALFSSAPSLPLLLFFLNHLLFLWLLLTYFQKCSTGILSLAFFSQNFLGFLHYKLQLYWYNKINTLTPSHFILKCSLPSNSNPAFLAL